MTPTTRIVKDIEDDICGRCGIGHEWERIDDDIKEEIRAKWRAIVNSALGIVVESKS